MRKSVVNQSVTPSTEQQRKLIHMIRFIEQEAIEKVEEIMFKTEEEFNIQKADYIQQGRQKINKEYQIKELNCKRDHQNNIGRLQNTSKITVLESKLKTFDDIKDEITLTIKSDMENGKRRWNILQSLIFEGLYKLLEPAVVLKCREIDANIISSYLSELEATYEDNTKKPISLTLSQTYLPNDILPGVIMTVPNNKVILNNTLEKRIDQIFQSSMPVLSQVFFGTSKLRTSISSI